MYKETLFLYSPYTATSHESPVRQNGVRKNMLFMFSCPFKPQYPLQWITTTRCETEPLDRPPVARGPSYTHTLFHHHSSDGAWLGPLGPLKGISAGV